MGITIKGDIDRVYLSESAGLECLGIMCFVKSEGSVTGGSLINVFANFEILKGNGLFYFIVTRGVIGSDVDEVRVRRLNSEVYVRDVYLEESAAAESSGYTKVEVVTILPHCSMAARRFVSNKNALSTDAATKVVSAVKTRERRAGVSGRAAKRGASKVQKKTSGSPEVDALVQRLYWEQNTAIQSVLRPSDFNASAQSALGMLSLDTLRKARVELKTLIKLLNEPGTSLEMIAYHSNRYNTLVPRVLDPNSDAWILNSADKVGAQFELLDVMEFALGSAFAGKAPDVDSAYEALNTTITPVEKGSRVYQEIERKMKKEQMSTHHLTTSLVAVYKIEQHGVEPFDTAPGNVVSLWHGTKAMNLTSILTNGLRLPANLGKNISRTGSMFGYGCYFGCYSKALQYSTARFDSSGKAKGNTSFLFLADVCLGNPSFTVTPCSISKAPAGYHSVYAVGRESLANGAEIMGIYPTKGWACSSRELSVLVGNRTPLLYDEIILYNLRRIKLRYLVEVKTGS